MVVCFALRAQLPKGINIKPTVHQNDKPSVLLLYIKDESVYHRAILGSGAAEVQIGAVRGLNPGMADPQKGRYPAIHLKRGGILRHTVIILYFEQPLNDLFEELSLIRYHRRDVCEFLIRKTSRNQILFSCPEDCFRLK